MVNMSEFISVDYLSVKDIEEIPMWRVISIVEKNNENKLEMTLENKDETKKVLTLNKTNLNTLIRMFGKNSVEVLGKMLILKIVDTEYKGEPTKGIRIDEEATNKL